MNLSSNPNNPKSFGASIASLWLRLVTVSIVGLLFAEALVLAERVQATRVYLTTLEVILETAMRLIFTALVGLGVGTLAIVLVTPAIWYFTSSRERIAEWVTGVAVVLVVFLDSRFALVYLIRWSYNVADHRRMLDMAAS